MLHDGRVGSRSYGRFAEFHFTDATPGLLRIPPGVWHADQNWGDTDVRVVNFPTRAYDHAQPDKYRIDPRERRDPVRLQPARRLRRRAARASRGTAGSASSRSRSRHQPPA